jgi:hypothetical protein
VGRQPGLGVLNQYFQFRQSFSDLFFGFQNLPCLLFLRGMSAQIYIMNIPAVSILTNGVPGDTVKKYSKSLTKRGESV